MVLYQLIKQFNRDWTAATRAAQRLDCCHQSCTSWLQYTLNQLSAGALPQTPVGELTALPQTP